MRNSCENIAVLVGVDDVSISREIKHDYILLKIDENSMKRR